MLTRDQDYAIKAHERVQLKVGLTGAKSYGVMAHKLPILIRTAGLAQALAFVEARGKEIQRNLLDDLAYTIGKEDKKELLRCAREEQLIAYMLLNKQIMNALLWYKRFAQSVLGVNIDDSIDEEGEEKDQ